SEEVGATNNHRLARQKRCCRLRSVSHIIMKQLDLEVRVMYYRLSVVRFALAVAILGLFVATAYSQKSSDKWLRVITGEDSVIDVDKSSLVLEPRQLIHADFRTTLLAEESIPEKPDVKYLTRLDSIQFNIRDGEYKILKSTLMDSAGNILLSFSPRD